MNKIPKMMFVFRVGIVPLLALGLSSAYLCSHGAEHSDHEIHHWEHHSPELQATEDCKSDCAKVVALFNFVASPASVDIKAPEALWKKALSSMPRSFTIHEEHAALYGLVQTIRRIISVVLIQ